MSTNAFIQARMSSSRLPGKVLMCSAGKPLLAHQIERVSRAKSLQRVVVLTSLDSSDDPIEQFCRGANIACYRGPLEDVLGRFWGALQQYPASNIVRLTADCPLSDPLIIDRVVQQHLDQANDYTSNCVLPGVPDGLDVEVMSVQALETAAKSADKMSEREHVTPYLRRPDTTFRIGHCDHIKGQEHQRWTVDYPEDFQLIDQILEHLYSSNPHFGFQEVLQLLHNKPELAQLNQGIQRNEGLVKSQTNDWVVNVNDDGQISELNGLVGSR